MNSRTRLIALALVTILLVVAAVVIVLRLQQDQAPDDSGAAGGTLPLTAPGETLRNKSCDQFLTKTDLQAAALTDLANAGPITSAKAKSGKQAANCQYDFSGSKGITLEAYGYASGEAAKDMITLFKQANASIATAYSTDTVGSARFAFGTDKTNPALCRLVIFSTDNKFEYASLVYQGFDCASSKELNKKIATSVSQKLLAGI